MIRVNENYLKIQASYLFTEIAHRVKAHQDAHPEAKVIRLGIGDVTEPLAPAVVAAISGNTAPLADLWVFIVGPLAGAALAALIYPALEGTAEE